MWFSRSWVQSFLCMTVFGTVIRTASMRPPKDYWLPKLEANRKRDARKEEVLRASGWRVLIVWECETHDLARLESRLHREFG